VAWSAIYIAYTIWHAHRYGAPTPPAMHFVTHFFYQGTAGHLYYLYAILGCYLLTPYLQVLVGGLTSGRVVGLAALFLAVGFINRASIYWLGLGIELEAVTFFVPYLGYFLLGRELRRLSLTPRVIRWAAIGFVGSFVYAAAFVLITSRFNAGCTTGWPAQRCLTRWQDFFPYEKFSISTMVMSVSVFLLFRAWAQRPLAIRLAGNWSRRAAEYVFGIYLLHPLILDLVESHYRMDMHLLPGWKIAFLIVVGTLLPIPIVAAIRATPGLRRIA
jgi:surface polysaccharide O-acyltransferase-like enzyme